MMLLDILFILRCPQDSRYTGNNHMKGDYSGFVFQNGKTRLPGGNNTVVGTSVLRSRVHFTTAQLQDTISLLLLCTKQKPLRMINFQQNQPSNHPCSGIFNPYRWKFSALNTPPHCPAGTKGAHHGLTKR